jgi:hypothetical protein
MTGRIRNRTITLGLVLASLVAMPARAWKVDGDASRAELEAFHRAFATASYLYPRHSAEALGWSGFFVYADLAFQPSFDRQGVSGNLPGGGLSLGRVGLRKGLPHGFDVGAALGKAGDLKVADAELQWTFVEGGAAKPALAARLTAGRAESGQIYKMTRWGAEVVLSKGLGPVTPFASAGLVRATGAFRPHGAPRFDRDETRPVLSAGLTLGILIPKLTFSVERGDSMQFAVRAAFGF